MFCDSSELCLYVEPQIVVSGSYFIWTMWPKAMLRVKLGIMLQHHPVFDWLFIDKLMFIFIFIKGQLFSIIVDNNNMKKAGCDA